jgi:DNA invertase Pin-like site-specific DNA recombinase
VDTTTPAGKALFQMMGVFAEFERAMIQERVKAGLQGAKAQGKVLGRPSTQLEKVDAIKAGLRAGSVGIVKLAKLHGMGVGTVQRIKAALATTSRMGKPLLRPRAIHSRTSGPSGYPLSREGAKGRSSVM